MTGKGKINNVSIYFATNTAVYCNLATADGYSQFFNIQILKLLQKGFLTTLCYITEHLS